MAWFLIFDFVKVDVENSGAVASRVSMLVMRMMIINIIVMDSSEKARD